MDTMAQGQQLRLPAPGPKATRPRLAARLRDYFLAGLLVTAPISITIYLTWSFISWVDDSILPFEVAALDVRGRVGWAARSPSRSPARVPMSS